MPGPDGDVAPGAADDPDAVAFAVDCTECEMGAAADELAPVAEFADKHPSHTRHEVEWVAMELAAELAGAIDREWEVRCYECADVWQFPSESEAGAWAEEHEAFTDHAPDGVQPTDSETVNPARVHEAIARLEARFEAGVPRELVEGALAEAGASERKVEETIRRLLRAGDCYEPAPGRLSAC